MSSAFDKDSQRHHSEQQEKYNALEPEVVKFMPNWGFVMLRQ